jgi:cell wall-associated NlpC family hydrolase
MPLTDQQREHIVEVAKSWYGTPYRGWTCLKGVGCDCGQLLKGVFMEAGHRPQDGVPTPKDYSLQVYLHRKDTTYIDTIAKYFREISETDVKPGDVVAYKLGKGFAHAAIVVKWPEHVIHTLKREGVHAGHGNNNKFGRLEKKFFTLRDEFCEEE